MCGTPGGTYTNVRSTKTFNPSGVGKPASVVLQTFNPSGVDV
jgi:hypothetical protein